MHELDMSKGRASMAYVGKTPWHGLGEPLQPGAPIETWAKASGLDFEVLKVPGYMLVNDQYMVVPDHCHIVRNDTLAPLGSFTQGYQQVQPAEILAFFRDYVINDDRFSMETAGALRGGKLIFALARYLDELKIAGDRHKVYIGLATSYDGSLSTTAQGTTVRWVCKNTISAGMMDKSAVIKIRHTAQFASPRQEQAAAELTAALQSVERYREMGDRLALFRMTQEGISDFFKYCLDIPLGMPREEISTRKYNQFEALLISLQQEYDAGTEKQTAWAALNAVTRYIDHERGARSALETQEQARLYSANFGSGAVMKSKAIGALVAAYKPS